VTGPEGGSLRPAGRPRPRWRCMHGMRCQRCVRRIGGGVASKTRIKGKPLSIQLYATARINACLDLASHGLWRVSDAWISRPPQPWSWSCCSSSASDHSDFLHTVVQGPYYLVALRLSLCYTSTVDVANAYCTLASA
jgi:hypothetical protein